MEMPKASDCGVVAVGVRSLLATMPQLVILHSNMPSPQNSQTTLPHRENRHSFTEYKKGRAGVIATAARLPETNSVKLLTQT